MLRRLFVGFVVIPIALLVTCLIFEHFRGRRLLQEELAKLQSSGETIDIKKLAPGRVPPTSNGLPVMLAAQRKLSPLSRFTGPPAFEMVAPGVAIAPTRIESWAGSGGSRTNTWSTLATAVEASAAGLEELQAALELPVRRAETDWDQGFSVPLPTLAPTKGIAVALGNLALHHAKRGDFTNAFADLEACRVLADDLRGEPMLIHQLVRIALVAIANGRTWGVLHAAEWTDPQLQVLQESVAPSEWGAAVLQSLRGERALVFQELRTKSARQVGEMLGGTPDLSGSFFGQNNAPLEMPDSFESATALAETAIQRLAEGLRSKVLFPLWYFAWGEQSLARYAQIMREWLQVQDRAVRQHSWREAASFDLVARLGSDSLKDRIANVIPRMLMPALEKAALKGFRAETEAALHQTAIALTRYHRQHGRYPEDLKALVPGFLSAVPVDRMDGQPIRYRRDAEGSNGFTLWSIGEDLKDDGGERDWPESQRSRTQWWTARDAVWPRAAAPAETSAWIKEQESKEKRAEEARLRKPESPGTSQSKISAELLKRYGLQLPAEPSSATNAPAAAAPSAERK